MVLVPVGCFMMGSEDGDSDEQPVHPQCIEEPFWIDKYEVTNADFARLGGKKADPSSFSGANRPIETITWFEALEFCQLREGSLPTELQWEYAARGIDSLIYPWGNLWNNNYAVWGRDDSQGTANVGSITFGSTGKSWIGALDMSGNVWEWTSTIYGFDFNHDYDFTDTEDFTFNYPYNDNDGRELYSNEVAYRRVLRGGSWSFTNSMNLRSAIRYSLNPSDSSKSGGFRCVRPVD